MTIIACTEAYRAGDAELTRPWVGQTTDTPGLLITPAAGTDGAWLGWTATHQQSGRSVSIALDDLDAIAKIANRLGELPIDWTADSQTTRQQVGEHLIHVVDVGYRGLPPRPELWAVTA